MLPTLKSSNSNLEPSLEIHTTKKEDSTAKTYFPISSSSTSSNSPRPIDIINEAKQSLHLSNSSKLTKSPNSNSVYRSPPKVPTRLSPLSLTSSPTSLVHSTNNLDDHFKNHENLLSSSSSFSSLSRIVKDLKEASNPSTMVPASALLNLLMELNDLFVSSPYDTTLCEFVKENGLALFPTLFQHPNPKVLYTSATLLAFIAKHSKVHASWVTQELIHSIMSLLSPYGLDTSTTSQLAYVLGQMTQTLSHVHAYMLPYKQCILELLVFYSMRYMKSPPLHAEGLNKENAGQVLIRLLRLLANLFLDSHLGFHWVSDPQFLILLDLLTEACPKCPNLNATLVLALHNQTYHAHENILFTRAKDLIQPLLKCIQENHESTPEILGILANLSRDKSILHLRFDKDAVHVLLTLILQENRMDLLIPLCGVWTNLVNFNLGAEELVKYPE
ncbi:hypothetical protein HMI55_000777, partial [Coelomomyces lativittatus]